MVEEPLTEPLWIVSTHPTHQFIRFNCCSYSDIKHPFWFSFQETRLVPHPPFRFSAGITVDPSPNNMALAKT
jgi:hypothetical protein